MSSDQTTSLEHLLSAAIWQRISWLAKSITQYNDFVELGGGLLPQKSGEDAAQSTTEDVLNAEKIAREFVQMTISEVFDAENVRILMAMENDGSILFADLQARLNTTDLALNERLSILHRARILDQQPGGSEIALTDAGICLKGLLEKTTVELANMVRVELPQILGKDSTEKES